MLSLESLSQLKMIKMIGSYVVLLRQAQNADRIPSKGLFPLPQAFAILSKLNGMVMSSIVRGSRPGCYLL